MSPLASAAICGAHWYLPGTVISPPTLAPLASKRWILVPGKLPLVT